MNTIRHRTTASTNTVRFTVTLAALVVVIALLAPAPARADVGGSTTTRSQLCATIDAGWWNTTGGIAATFSFGFWGSYGELYGGETITFTPGTVRDPDAAVLTLATRTGNGKDAVVVATTEPGAPSVSWVTPRTTLTALRGNVSTGNFWDMGWTCEARPPGPAKDLDDLRGEVAALQLHAGFTNALDTKLEAAWTAAWQGDAVTACRYLVAVEEQLAAQTGRKLDADQAAWLRDATAPVLEELDC